NTLCNVWLNPLRRHSSVEIIWLEIKKETSGQLATFYLARKYLRPRIASTVIFNCDTYFRSSTLLFLVQDQQVEGIIPCAKAPGKEWSFCSVSKKNDVLAIEEKKRISSFATVGFYYFRDTLKLLKRTQIALSSKTKNEHYVAPLYKEYIKKNELLKICEADLFLPMGTPGQIKKYWQINTKDLLVGNSKKVIVVDLDNTITIDLPQHSYENKKPNVPLIKRLWLYKRAGFTIIIHTARNMKTQNGDEGKTIANIGRQTLYWLKKHKVPYDSIRFGKPFAEEGFYLDDKAIRPKEFLDLEYEELIKLLKN
ncbi:MAG: hypothetical protein Q7U04_10595, partial [Bacteriovorax sp.]|nr:hypothetical protein [Bacteriovorax sp.]